MRADSLHGCWRANKEKNQKKRAIADVIGHTCAFLATGHSVFHEKRDNSTTVAMLNCFSVLHLSFQTIVKRHFLENNTTPVKEMIPGS